RSGSASASGSSSSTSGCFPTRIQPPSGRGGFFSFLGGGSSGGGSEPVGGSSVSAPFEEVLRGQPRWVLGPCELTCLGVGVSGSAVGRLRGRLSGGKGSTDLGRTGTAPALSLSSFCTRSRGFGPRRSEPERPTGIGLEAVIGTTASRGGCSGSSMSTSLTGGLAD